MQLGDFNVEKQKRMLVYYNQKSLELEVLQKESIGYIQNLKVKTKIFTTLDNFGRRFGRIHGQELPSQKE